MKRGQPRERLTGFALAQVPVYGAVIASGEWPFEESTFSVLIATGALGIDLIVCLALAVNRVAALDVRFVRS